VPRRTPVLAAAAVVLLWRGAALASPSTFIAIPDGLHVPMALLGVLFVACGVLAWELRPGRWTAVFLLHALGGGVHWGGAIGAAHAGLDLGLFFVYLAASCIGEAALLHLALIYPLRRRLERHWQGALYAPGAAALVFAAGAWAVPQTALEPVVMVLIVLANLLSITGGVLLLVRIFTVDPALRRRARLPWIVGGLVVGSGVALLGARGTLPGEPEAWNLAHAVIPLCLAFALARFDGHDATA
jgi:hypothetical protein